MPFPEEKLHTLKTIDQAFDAGTRENYILNTWLLIINAALLVVVALDFAHILGYIHLSDFFHDVIRNVEIITGMVFLVEFTLRSIFVYIPDKKFYSWYPVINVAVIISLLAPHFIGNLAVLKFVKILKALKIYKLGRENNKGKKISA